MKVCMLGTDFLSSNRGCGALGYSTVYILSKLCEERKEPLEIYSAVHTMGKLALPENAEISADIFQIRPRKLFFWRKLLEVFHKCDFIIDFTGGDSFADLYGNKRFYLASVIKQLALWSRTPFIMGPQTIGPFHSGVARRFAAHILRKADACWTRDRMSQAYMEEICGRVPSLTTDVAFSLPTAVTMKIQSEKKKIGFNPSGLLWSKNRSFQADKHITIDYRDYVKQVIGTLAEDPRYQVYLLPHVFDKQCNFEENDLKACREIHEMFPSSIIIQDYDSPMEAKGVISQMDVFIGARMHATIGAFSSGVATIPFSYSRKFEGLYHDLDYPYLISGEKMNTEDAVQTTLKWIENDDLLRQKVTLAGPCIESRKTEFFTMLKNLTA